MALDIRIGRCIPCRRNGQHAVIGGDGEELNSSKGRRQGSLRVAFVSKMRPRCRYQSP